MSRPTTDTQRADGVPLEVLRDNLLQGRPKHTLNFKGLI